MLLSHVSAVLVHGLPVWNRSLPFAEAVVIVDAALHRHLVTREELDVALGRATRRPGTPAADRVFRFASPGSMSVGESRSRVRTPSTMCAVTCGCARWARTATAGPAGCGAGRRGVSARCPAGTASGSAR